MRAMVLSGLAALAMSGEGVASEVPVLLEYPGCRYDSLGEVQASAGARPDGSPQDSRLRGASYHLVLERLAREGAVRGANGVVVREHQAAFYSSNGRRTARPVHVVLVALAIRMDEPSACRTRPVDASEMQRRAVQGTATDVVIDAKAPVL